MHFLGEKGHSTNEHTIISRVAKKNMHEEASHLPCPHHLYICHCTPSTMDPAPIEPAGGRRMTGSGGPLGQQRRLPVYVTRTSVAVMTSPTLETSASMSSLSGGDKATVGRRQTTCHTLPRVLVHEECDGQYRRPHFHSALAPEDNNKCAWPQTAAMEAPPPACVLDDDPRFGASSRRATAAAMARVRGRECILVGCFPILPRFFYTERGRRACLERAALTVLATILAALLAVAALAVVYAGQYGRVGARRASSSPALDVEDGVEIVRIRTTEEVVRKEALFDAFFSQITRAGTGDARSKGPVLTRVVGNPCVGVNVCHCIQFSAMSSDFPPFAFPLLSFCIRTRKEKPITRGNKANKELARDVWPRRGGMQRGLPSSWQAEIVINLRIVRNFCPRRR